LKSTTTKKWTRFKDELKWIASSAGDGFFIDTAELRRIAGLEFILLKSTRMLDVISRDSSMRWKLSEMIGIAMDGNCKTPWIQQPG
jgi:hypothetical protein